MSDQDNEIWKAGYDIKAKYQDREMTLTDWTDLGNECRDLYEAYKTTFAMHMATMLLDLFMDISQQQKAAG